MKTLSLKVPESLDQDLAALAGRRGVSKSSLIRGVMSDHIARQKVDDQGISATSFLAGARDLAGIAEGPEDLSHHAKHLAGYGQ